MGIVTCAYYPAGILLHIQEESEKGPQEGL